MTVEHVTALENCNAQVTRNDQGQVVTVNLIDGSLTDAEVEHVAALNSLETLYLDGTDVTDSGLERLAGLPRLGTIGLSETQITDTGIRHLLELPQLHTLDLPNQITDSGLLQLQEQRTLKRLILI